MSDDAGKARYQKARDAKRRISQAFLGQGGIVGVGLSKRDDGSYAIRVNVEIGAAAPADLPIEEDGHEIEIHRVGQIKPL